MRYILGICMFFFSYISIVHADQKNNTIQLKNMSYKDHAIKPYKKDGCFFNHDKEHCFTHISDAFKIFWKTKTSLNNYYTDDMSTWIKHDTPQSRSIALSLQWIGHASFLIQVHNFNILTDPVFFDLNTVLYPRKTPVGIPVDQLPTIDFVIISHNHRDHTDQASLEVLIPQQPIMLVPAGTKDYFVGLGFIHVYEHDWWQSCVFKRNNDAIEFTFVPAVHWSGRNIFDAHTSLWGGWIIKAQEKTVYFAGDTGFSENICNAIAAYAPSIDCALLPIGWTL